MAGSPLFRGVSLKLERRDRLTLAGRNGAGKTTLLRMLAGEAGIDGGELAFEKGVRIALHDQRPPRDRDSACATTCSSGCADLVSIEEELGRLEAGDGGGRRDASERSTATAPPRRASSTPAATRGASAALAQVRGLGFVDARPRPRAARPSRAAS